MAKKRSRSSTPVSTELPPVNFTEDGECRYLHLGTEWIQGAMRLDDPLVLELEYIQRIQRVPQILHRFMAVTNRLVGLIDHTSVLSGLVHHILNPAHRLIGSAYHAVCPLYSAVGKIGGIVQRLVRKALYDRKALPDISQNV